MKNITLLDPDGSHVAVYIDGKLYDADNGMSDTSRFLQLITDLGVKLPVDIEYRHVDLTEEQADRFPPKRLPGSRKPMPSRPCTECGVRSTPAEEILCAKCKKEGK